MNQKKLNTQRIRRTKRTRSKIHGTAKRPRLVVFRSNRYSYAQLIDDEAGVTLVSGSTREIKTAKGKGKTEPAKELGTLVAKRAKEKGIASTVFDRRGYKYHGRVAAVAEALREAGIKV